MQVCNILCIRSLLFKGPRASWCEESGVKIISNPDATVLLQTGENGRIVASG